MEEYKVPLYLHGEIVGEAIVVDGETISITATIAEKNALKEINQIITVSKPVYVSSRAK